jgi:hypothetical protein
MKTQTNTKKKHAIVKKYRKRNKKGPSELLKSSNYFIINELESVVTQRFEELSGLLLKNKS